MIQYIFVCANHFRALELSIDSITPNALIHEYGLQVLCCWICCPITYLLDKLILSRGKWTFRFSMNEVIAIITIGEKLIIADWRISRWHCIAICMIKIQNCLVLWNKLCNELSQTGICRLVDFITALLPLAIYKCQATKTVSNTTEPLPTLTWKIWKSAGKHDVEYLSLLCDGTSRTRTTFWLRALPEIMRIWCRNELTTHCSYVAWYYDYPTCY